ncbi:hypothetical protein ACJJI5_04970 [Microbulbifer sp. EKSA008]|uniref:hypothetical protein n=1 Tax=Microbulbifer sp. EKSA008 TaxID=3243367 RepID=UPI004041B69D
MIEYRYPEEKTVALFFAELLQDTVAMDILERGYVTTSEEATHLSKFFWAMVEKSAQEPELPCEASPEYSLEKLYNSFGGYLFEKGYEQQWDNEIDNA